MKLNYNVTGEQRKALVTAISEIIGKAPIYKGAPTFAYVVENYTIDKTGTVTGADSLDLEDSLHQRGYNAIEREYDEPDTYESGLGEFGADDLPGCEGLDNTGHEDGLLESDVHEAEADDVNEAENETYGGYMEYNTHSMNVDASIYESGEPDRLIIEVPRTGFTSEKLENLSRLVSAKARLIMAALGTDTVTVEQTAETLRFPWFSGNLDAEHTRAYSTFISLLCKTAKEKQRVTAKERDVDENPKYAMRCWLLALGFIGAEYKVSRKSFFPSWMATEPSKAVNGDRPQMT